MADRTPPFRLDLDELERLIQRDGFLAQGLAADAISELRRRRAEGESDRKFMQQQIDEVGRLKRRLEKLRSALKPGFDVWSAQRALEADTAAMRRAISQERARIAKLREAARRG